MKITIKENNKNLLDELQHLFSLPPAIVEEDLYIQIKHHKDQSTFTAHRKLICTHTVTILTDDFSSECETYWIRSECFQKLLKLKITLGSIIEIRGNSLVIESSLGTVKEELSNLNYNDYPKAEALSLIGDSSIETLIASIPSKSEDIYLHLDNGLHLYGNRENILWKISEYMPMDCEKLNSQLAGNIFKVLKLKDCTLSFVKKPNIGVVLVNEYHELYLQLNSPRGVNTAQPIDLLLKKEDHLLETQVPSSSFNNTILWQTYNKDEVDFYVKDNLLYLGTTSISPVEIEDVFIGSIPTSTLLNLSNIFTKTNIELKVFNNPNTVICFGNNIIDVAFPL